MLTSVKICMQTPSCLEVPQCTQVSLTECKRKSLPWLHPPSKSRSLLHQKENTPYGSEDPSWLPSPPSNRCGSPSKNTTNAAHPLSTENAFKYYFLSYLVIQRYILLLFVILVITNEFKMVRNGFNLLKNKLIFVCEIKYSIEFIYYCSDLYL